MFWLALLFIASGPQLLGNRPVTASEEIVAIYTNDGALRPGGGLSLKLVLVAWGDGQLVWSHDTVKGGAPYFAGEVSAARVAAVLERAERDGFFADETLNQPHYGPDSRYTTILLKRGGHRVEMRSWHELYEIAGRVVSGASGLRALDGRNRLQALRNEPPEYLYYRMVWADLRALAGSLRPAEGRPVRGQLVMTARVVSWEEAAPGE